MRGLVIGAIVALGIGGCFSDVEIVSGGSASASGAASSSSSASVDASGSSGSSGGSAGSSGSSSGAESSGGVGSIGVTQGESSSGGAGSTSGGDTCGPCDMPPGTCYLAPGECVDGACVYPPRAAGEACDDGDGCSVDDACDGAGKCGGAPKTCSKPHATGTCTDGACGQWTCTAPWKDCDGDISNGCEIPVGVPNQCDAGGLNAGSGCWTAYCGSSGSVKAKNFGTFYCVDCENCHSPQQGKVQWCNHSSGEWYTPPADGACGSYLDKVCVP